MCEICRQEQAMVTANQQDAYWCLWCISTLDIQQQNALHPQPNLATTYEQAMQTKFFEHPDELRSLHCAALPTVASTSHQTTELQANILAVLTYDTQATDHELHESTNSHHYYLLTNGFFAWLHCLGPTGPGTQHQSSQVQQPACSARRCGHIPNKHAKQGQTNPHRVAPDFRQI